MLKDEMSLLGHSKEQQICINSGKIRQIETIWINIWSPLRQQFCIGRMCLVKWTSDFRPLFGASRSSCSFIGIVYFALVLSQRNKKTLDESYEGRDMAKSFRCMRLKE